MAMFNFSCPYLFSVVIVVYLWETSEQSLLKPGTGKHVNTRDEA